MQSSKKAPGPSLSYSLVALLLLFIPFESYAHDTSSCAGRLPNGLTYYIHHDPHSKHHTSLDFVIKAGSLDEQENESGFCHLMEHTLLHKMQFKGKKLTDLYCEIWDYTYPDLGGVVSYDFTQYHFEISRALPQGLEEGLLGFSNALLKFDLDEDYLQEMKEEVIEENRFSPIESWKQWRIELEYPPYRNNSPFGNKESIYEASLEKIHQFYKQKYQAHRFAVIIIGNVDLQKTKEWIEKALGTLSTPCENETLKSHSESFSERIGIYINKGLKNTFLSLTKPLPRMSQRETLTFSILTRMLSQHLQNCAGVSQATFSQPILELLTYPEMLRLTVSLNEHFEEGIDQLKSALKSFFIPSITKDQLDPIKTAMKNSLEIVREKGNDPCLIDFYRDHFILKASSLETDHPDLRIHLLDTIHAEDINQMLQTFQGFSQATLCSKNASRISPDLLSKLLLKITDDRRNTDVN
jgi:hypothetical protein